MPAPRPGVLLRHLQPADPDDAALLARAADPAAFAAIVRRHGPVVFAVCRRVTGHAQDAEDAFQAVFLVLARSAGTVRHPDRLGAWLAGVAAKVAGRARRTAARRRLREVQVPAFPDPPAAAAPPPDIGPALHEELAALPALHREPIVLCDLQGLSRADAARALGVPEGTLSSRLANGRKKLAARLLRRGVALAAAAVPAAVADGRAAVPELLVSNTCGLVAAWAAGSAVPGGVLRLARGGFPMRGVMLGGVLSLSLSLAAGVVLATAPGRPPADPLPPPDPPAAAVAVQDAKPPEPKKDAPPATFGAPKLTRKEDIALKHIWKADWSGDGSVLALQGRTSKKTEEETGGSGRGEQCLAVVPMADRAMCTTYEMLPDEARLCGFTPDGRTVLILKRESGLISGAYTIRQLSLRIGKIFELNPAKPQDKKGLVITPAGEAEVPSATVEFNMTPNGTAHYLAWELGRYPFRRFEVGLLDPKTFARRGAPAEVEGLFRWVHLAPNGQRVVAVTEEEIVEAYGVDGKRAWAGEPPAPSADVPSGFDTRSVQVAVAGNGSRVLVARGIRPPEVLDGATGKALAPLEPGEPVYVGRGAAVVSADGRLAALSYSTLGRKKALRGPVETENRFTVWDTTTGKVVRSWPGRAEALAFHPTRPVLAVLEANDGQTRLGLWEFSAE